MRLHIRLVKRELILTPALGFIDSYIRLYEKGIVIPSVPRAHSPSDAAGEPAALQF